MAIAFDAKTDTTATCSVASKTITHTCTGSDGILFAFVENHTAHGTISSVTYNAASLTKIDEYNDGTVRVGLWYIVAPATGSAYNLTANCTAGTGCIALGAASFTGASQTGVPDASFSGTTAATTSFSQSVTSVADNCFAVWSVKAPSGGPVSGGTNTTVTQPEVTAHGGMFAYSTAAQTPAGTFTLNLTGPSAAYTGVIASFAPAGGGGGGATYRRKALLGVGQ